MEQIIYPISYMMLTANSLGISSCIIGAMGNEITGILPEISTKAKEKLGWEPKTTLEELCQMMVEQDLRRNTQGFSF